MASITLDKLPEIVDYQKYRIQDEKKFGVIASTVAPVDVDLVGSGLLSLGLGAELHQFVENGKSEKPVNDIAVDMLKFQTITAAEIDLLDKKLFLLDGETPNGETILNYADDPQAIADWINSDKGARLIEAIRRAAAIKASRFVDFAALHGKNPDGSDIVGNISFADQSSVVVPGLGADAFDAAQLAIDGIASNFGITKAEYAQLFVDAKKSTGTNATPAPVRNADGSVVYQGLIGAVSDTVETELESGAKTVGYVFDGKDVEWGFSAPSNIEIFDSGLTLKKNNKVAVRYEIYTRWAWYNLANVAVITDKAARAK